MHLRLRILDTYQSLNVRSPRHLEEPRFVDHLVKAQILTGWGSERLTLSKLRARAVNRSDRHFYATSLRIPQ